LRQRNKRETQKKEKKKKMSHLIVFKHVSACNLISRTACVKNFKNKTKVAAHTIGTKVSECLEQKFVLGEKNTL
jgi:hypothetical protein